MLPRRGTEIYIRIRAVLSFSLHILAAGTRARIVDRGSVKTALVGNKLVICEWTVINVRMSRRVRFEALAVFDAAELESRKTRNMCTL